MFLSEDRLEVVKVDCGIASISPFRIDIPSSSESIWFGTEITRTEPDDKVELRKVLGPSYLSLDQYLDSKKILKIFMVCNNINGIGWTFQVVLPNIKSFKDGEQFLVMYVVIQICCSEKYESEKQLGELHYHH